MFSIAGQTAGPIGLKFFVDTLFSAGNAGPFSLFLIVFEHLCVCVCTTIVKCVYCV